MANKLQHKEIDGIVFYKRKYKDDWIISGIDICKHLGYKNPSHQAKQIYNRFKKNFKDTSFVIKMPRATKKTSKGGTQIEVPLLDQNEQETRCYSRAGLWFFTSKCNIPKANKLIENLFKKFDKLLKFLRSREKQDWQLARQKGKEARTLATDGIQILEEYATDCGSKNGHTYYSNITKMIYKELFGTTKVPPKFRDSLTRIELSSVEMIEISMKDWIEQCIDHNLDHHELYQKIKETVKEHSSLLIQMRNKKVLSF